MIFIIVAQDTRDVRAFDKGRHTIATLVHNTPTSL